MGAKRVGLWLGAAIVAALLGFALWRSGLAAPPPPGAPAATAQAAQLPDLPEVPARKESAQVSYGRPAQAGWVKDFEALKERAKAGDAVAQRLLAETYDGCYMVNFDREGFFKDLQVRREMLGDPAHAAVLDQTAQERALRCDAVDGGVIIPLALIRGWYAQAAENGDLAARLMDNALSQKKLDAAESAKLVEEVLASNDAAAVFAIGNTVGSTYRGAPDDPLAALMIGEQSSPAWQVAACRMGYDCAPSSILMGSLCLATNACAGDGYEEFLMKSQRTDADRRDLERRVTEILRLVEGR